ncbi:MAG: outer membrane beta-barrel protein [Saprospiraceae bacterium]
MDKNLPKDPLEEFFKKSLEGQDDLPSDDGWDVPSSNVWDRVEADIQPTTIVRPINYWKWATVAASVVLLFFAYQWTSQNQQIENLTTEVDKNNEQLEHVKELLENKQKELETTIAEQNTHTIDNHQSIIDEEVSPRDNSEMTQSETSFSGNNENGIGGNNNINPPSISTRNSENIANQNLENVPLLKTNDTNSPKENVIVENNPSTNLDKINSDNSMEILIKNKLNEMVEKLPSRVFITESIAKEENLKSNFEETVALNINKRKIEKGFYTGIYGSRNLGKRSIHADDSNLSQARIDKINSIPKKESWTAGGGVKLGFQINKNWSIESGLQYTKSEITARHRIQKQYNNANETLNSSGDFENEFAFLLITSMGDVESDVTLSRAAANPIVDQLSFNIPVESNQKISFLGIPILAKYSLGNERFRFGVKGGFLTNFILDADVEISAVDAPFPGLRPRRNRINNKAELKNLKSTTIDWLAGIEAEVKINESMYFSLEPSFSKSTSPIFEKNKVKTYPMMANVKVGVNYLF